MILLIKKGADPKKIETLRSYIENKGLIAQDIVGASTRMMGIAGDTATLTREYFEQNEIIESIIKVSESYKMAGRKFHPQDTIINVKGQKIGGGNFAVFAGPCSVETKEQILETAVAVQEAGANFLRGGAFKPRSSPYAFDGLGLEGLELLKLARDKTGLPIVSEIMSSHHLSEFERDVDIIQIGARNMQNFTLLREVGALKKPVLLKRGLSSTLDEFLMAAEYLMAAGSAEIILCERGIRTFETATRNTLDLSAVPVLQSKSHLPVIVDPSHGTGYWQLVFPLSLAAVAVGANGLLIEVHSNPEAALCDGGQSIKPKKFTELMHRINKVRMAIAGNEDV